jgi:hypothetical protein
MIVPTVNTASRALVRRDRDALASLTMRRRRAELQPRSASRVDADRPELAALCHRCERSSNTQRTKASDPPSSSSIARPMSLVEPVSSPRTSVNLDV